MPIRNRFQTGWYIRMNLLPKFSHSDNATFVNRLNYILWLQDIVEATFKALNLKPEGRVKGIDMYGFNELTKRLLTSGHSGTGASAIYPLLGCRTDPRWSFVATGVLPYFYIMLLYDNTLYHFTRNGWAPFEDIDEKSLSFARLNVRRNGLEGRISVMQSDIQGPILLPLFERRILRHASDEQLQINIASTSSVLAKYPSL